MTWRYGGEQFSHFAAYRIAVLATIAQDLEPWDWPWLRKTQKVPRVSVRR